VSDHAADRVMTDAPNPRRDLRLLYVARAARNFGDGFAVIVLPAYLAAIGFESSEIGLVATAALAGAALLTLMVGWLAPRFDLRSLLIAGATLMAATGLAMPNAQHLALIMVFAFVGTMNMATGDIGVLVPIEHAMLAREAADAQRTRVFARYSLIGTFASAGGALASARCRRCRRCSISMRRSVSSGPRAIACCRAPGPIRLRRSRRRSALRAASSTSSRRCSR
jgi:hypothetical protein